MHALISEELKGLVVALVCGSLLAAGAHLAIAQQEQQVAPPAGNEEAAQWLPSIVDSAKNMGVELTPECLAALTQAITERGFKRAAVTARGSVLVRDAQGNDVWVCR